MAKLGSYFSLCPLIDQQNLLGISDDVNKGHVIVTLARNIAVKYRVSDQKQIQSWRTKDKFSSPVIYDKNEGKYIGTFNSVNVKMWSDDDEHLDKLKKYKFNEPIYTLVSVGGRSFVVFKNGNILPLSNALENRKDLSFLKVFEDTNEEIQDVINIDIRGKVYFGVITSIDGKLCLYMSTILDNNSNQQIQIIPLERKDCKLSGYVFCQMFSKNLHFLSLWSDNKLYSYQVTGMKDKTDPEPFGTVYATIQSILPDTFVAMEAINSDQIAIYGANPNREGARLIIYNTQFKVLQSTQSFKLFAKAKRIWCYENALFICTGQSLAVVPYYINTEQLSALVGSHKIDPNETDYQQTVQIKKWDSDIDIQYQDEVPSGIKDKVNDLLSQGLAESLICEHLIPFYTEKDDTSSLELCLDYFKDISEKCISDLLVFLIQRQWPSNSDLDSVNCRMIDKLLVKPTSDILLLPHLKTNFDVSTALFLVRYVSYLLSPGGHKLPGVDHIRSEQRIIEWGSMLLDANYQKFLLSRDTAIADVLTCFNTLVEAHMDCVKDFRAVAPICENMVRGKAVNSVKSSNNFWYAIREIKL